MAAGRDICRVVGEVRARSNDHVRFGASELAGRTMARNRLEAYPAPGEE